MRYTDELVAAAEQADPLLTAGLANIVEVRVERAFQGTTHGGAMITVYQVFSHHPSAGEVAANSTQSVQLAAPTGSAGSAGSAASANASATVAGIAGADESGAASVAASPETSETSNDVAELIEDQVYLTSWTPPGGGTLLICSCWLGARQQLCAHGVAVYHDYHLHHLHDRGPIDRNDRFASSFEDVPMNRE